MGFLSDFKTFAVKGNLADLAIGVVIGAAFTKVIGAFIDGMIMPLVGYLTGGTDFMEMKKVLSPAISEVKDAAGAVVTKGVPEVAIKYGAFIAAIITFMMVALVCYMIIKNLLKKDPNAVPDPTPTESLLAEIRDSLKK
jgi:large conductance mechanosensitive channel